MGTPTSRVVRELALRGAEAFEGDEAAEQSAADFALSVADGTSGLDLESLTHEVRAVGNPIPGWLDRSRLG